MRVVRAVYVCPGFSFFLPAFETWLTVNGPLERSSTLIVLVDALPIVVPV